MKPRLDPIPLQEMPRYEWWSSIYHSDWYYHTPRQHFEIDVDVLERTLDPCLKPLALLLLEYGIFTGPSCQGLHDDHGNEDKREDAYRSLSDDAQVIRTRGLVLRNVENGDEIVYYDPNYELPWSYDKFFKKAGTPDHGKVGYLPFYFNDEHESLVDLLEEVIIHVPGAKISIRENTAAIQVYGKNYKSQCESWNLIYQYMVKYA